MVLTAGFFEFSCRAAAGIKWCTRQKRRAKSALRRDFYPESFSYSARSRFRTLFFGHCGWCTKCEWLLHAWIVHLKSAERRIYVSWVLFKLIFVHSPWLWSSLSSSVRSARKLISLPARENSQCVSIFALGRIDYLMVDKFPPKGLVWASAASWPAANLFSNQTRR